MAIKYIKWIFMMSILMGFVALLVGVYVLQNNSPGTEPLTEQNIIIGVLSAQNNFEARKSIRDTWKNLVNSQSVSLYFLIGDTFCTVPTADRISPHSCVERSMRDIHSKVEEISTFKACDYNLKPIYSGFTFLVHSAIVIKRLTIINNIVSKFQRVKVHLIDSATHEKIVSVSFTRTNNSYNSKVLSKAVDRFVLPQGFEGQIVMDIQEPLPLIYNCSFDWNNASNVISYIQLISTKDQKPAAFHHHSCSPVSMIFDIHDPEEVMLQVNSRASRQDKWDETNVALKKQLLEESREMKDIVFLNIIDVYRSLSKKLLFFLQWIYTNKKFSFVIKTDDDTFLNVAQIEQELFAVKQSYSNRDSPFLWWWGLFREQWAVSSSGKWREDIYRSLTYPSFPCGAGYVLSYDVVGYLVKNAAFLQTNFQGEDVSVGIWLAGLDTIQHRSEKLTWSCDEVCLTNGCNRAQLSVDEMYTTWESYNKCGSLCNCSA